MAFLNFGLYQGASAKIPYDQMMQQETYIHSLERQNRIDAENKAKLLSDDIEFATVSADFNRKQLNDFYQKKFTDLGNYYIENPDMFLNPVKMLQFKRMKRDLVDNDIVAEDMRYQTNYKSLTKWLADNPGAADYDEDAQKMLQDVENYRLYGSTTLDGKKNEFVFIDPDTKVNMQKELSDHFAKTVQNGIEVIPGPVEPGYKQYATDADIYTTAQGLATNQRLMRVVDKEWNKLTAEMKARYKNDKMAYIAELGKSYVPTPKVEMPRGYSSVKAAGGGAEQSVNGNELPPLRKAIYQASQKRGLPQPVVPAAMNKTFRTAEGTINLSDGFLMKQNGQVEAFSQEQAWQLNDVPATNLGEVYVDADGNAFSTWQVSMAVPDFVTFWGNSDPIDYSGFLQFVGSPGNNPEIHEADDWMLDRTDYRKFLKISTNEKGEKVVSFTVKKPMDMNEFESEDSNLMYNQVLGAKAVELSHQSPAYGVQQGPPSQIKEGQIIKLKDGRLYHVTGFDQNGKPIGDIYQ